METCPRCSHNNLRLEHEGKEDGKLIWSSYYCQSCHYSFRDSEPENILNPDKRDPYFNLDTVDPADFKTLFPANPGKK